MAPSDFLYKIFDPFIDCSELESLHLEICAGISQSKTNMSSRVIPHYEMADDYEKLIEFKLNESARIGTVANEGFDFLTNEEEKTYFQELNHEQKKRFLQLSKSAYWDGEYVRLKFTRPEFLDHPYSTFNNSMCQWHPNAQFFPKTVEFIKRLPFREIGRILFFVSFHYLHSDVHYDRQDPCFDGTNHFIWLNPFQQKQFFLIDDQKVRHEVIGKTAFFNTRYLHGSSPSPTMTYSLRVDGQLEEDFCNKTGILWKKR